jgi:hypothetical protein
MEPRDVWRAATVVEGLDVVKDREACSLFGREGLSGVRKFGFE